MAIQSPEEGYPVTVREIDWTAEVIKSYGPAWKEPEVQYVFSNGRKIKMHTQQDIYDA
jgi:hypothetical protein